MEFNVNCCRIASKTLNLGFTKIRDTLRPGKTQAVTRDTGPEIRDVPGNTGRLATLPAEPFLAHEIDAVPDDPFRRPVARVAVQRRRLTRKQLAADELAYQLLHLGDAPHAGLRQLTDLSNHATVRR